MSKSAALLVNDSSIGHSRGCDHITIIQRGTPLEELLIKWATARFANEPQATGCVRKSF
jgi:hypothetical protein